MKKFIISVLVFCLAFVPFIAKASEKINLDNYSTLGFRETLASEEMEEKFKSYKTSDDQITIYLFRGQGCHYCQGFLTFLNSIADEYGKYFKLVSFETWGDRKNDELLQEISAFLEQPAQGVPYIIIGEQVFGGFAEEYEEQIKAAIKNLYSSEERYDVIEAYNDYLDEQAKAANAGTVKIIVWNFILTLLVAAVVIGYISYSNNKLYNRLTEEKHIVAKEINIEKSVKKPVNKQTNKK